VVVIRATRKLLDRLGPLEADPPESSTVLGDWYAKPFSIAQRRFILLVSQKSRVAVLMPGREVANLPRNFPDALGAVLSGLGIPQDAVDREIAATRDAVVAATASKSLLGTLNDYAYMTQFGARDGRELDLVRQSLWLSQTPLGPLGYKYAADVARELFGLEPQRPRRPF
jgi:hypothetical protein